FASPSAARPRRGRLTACWNCFQPCASALATRARNCQVANSRCWRSPVRWSANPQVLLLDEPSQGLAPLVVRELARVIRLLCQDGVTILLIEQNLKLAVEVADRLAIMVRGRIVYGANPATFRAEEGSVRSRYLMV